MSFKWLWNKRKRKKTNKPKLSPPDSGPKAHSSPALSACPYPFSSMAVFPSPAFLPSLFAHFAAPAQEKPRPAARPLLSAAADVLVPCH